MPTEGTGTVLERHRHDSLDLFPDFGRQVFFGVGASIAYHYLDYRLRNDADQPFQLSTWVEGAYLCGQLRALRLPPEKYHIRVQDEYFLRQGGALYQRNTILRRRTDRKTGRWQEEVLMRNKAWTLYDENYIDPALIRQEQSKQTEE